MQPVKERKVKTELRRFLFSLYAAILLTVPVFALSVTLVHQLRSTSQPSSPGNGTGHISAKRPPLAGLVFLHFTAPVLSLVTSAIIFVFLKLRSLNDVGFRPILVLHLVTLALFLAWLSSFIIWTNCDLHIPGYDSEDIRFPVCKEWPILSWRSSGPAVLSSWTGKPYGIPTSSIVQRCHFAFALIAFLSHLLVAYFAAFALRRVNDENGWLLTLQREGRAEIVLSGAWDNI